MDETAWLDATEQARLVREGDLSPRELALFAIGRIERDDPMLATVVSCRFEEALASLEQCDPTGPFAGVPMLVKDLYCDTAGDLTAHGNRALRDAGVRAESDSFLSRRYRRAGFTILGRTSTPEFGLVPVTEPAAFPTTRNPWDLSRSPGGSSGGSAAAVAAGLVPLAHGSDGGGSIRIPASMCGLVGLKPSRGRISAGPGGDESGLSVQHVLTRSVRDTAGVLDATAGPGTGDIVVAPAPRRPFLEERDHPLRGLRIGLLRHSPNGPLHPHCAEAVATAAALLEEQGHHVVEEHPAVLDEAEENGRRFMARWAVTARMSVLASGEMLARALDEEDVEPLTWAMAERGRTTSAENYAAAVAGGVRFARRLADFFETHDLLLTPTLGEPPPRIGELTPPPEAPFATQRRTGTLVPFTMHFNVSGQPALSLPISLSREGLPIGVQLVAGYAREDVLINVAFALEEAIDWSTRRPPALGHRRDGDA